NLADIAIGWINAQPRRIEVIWCNDIGSVVDKGIKRKCEGIVQVPIDPQVVLRAFFGRQVWICQKGGNQRRIVGRCSRVSGRKTWTIHIVLIVQIASAFVIVVTRQSNRGAQLEQIHLVGGIQKRFVRQNPCTREGRIEFESVALCVVVGSGVGESKLTGKPRIKGIVHTSVYGLPCIGGVVSGTTVAIGVHQTLIVFV